MYITVAFLNIKVYKIWPYCIVDEFIFSVTRWNYEKDLIKLEKTQIFLL